MSARKRTGANASVPGRAYERAQEDEHLRGEYGQGRYGQGVVRMSVGRHKGYERVWWEGEHRQVVQANAHMQGGEGLRMSTGMCCGRFFMCIQYLFIYFYIIIILFICILKLHYIYI